MKPLFSHQTTPVDIVYLWVDGQDPTWQAKRSSAQARLNPQERQGLAPYSTVEGRFRNNDELRYSLRALQQFFPQHGHVFIVTDGQTPAWLKPNAGLTVIDHRDLIPLAQLPTFDSGNIESYIHRILGLSERFFYFNDDVFFGAPVRIDDWFSENGIYVTWSHDAPIEGEHMLSDDTALMNASRLSQQWLAASERLNLNYVHTPRTFAHSPRPMLKSLMLEVERLAPDLFDMVRSTVFRVWDKPTIVSDFVLRWALANGRAQLHEHSHLHISSGDAIAAQLLSNLPKRFGEIDFFCINDTMDNAESQDIRLVRVRETLQTILPNASSFEQSALN